MKNDFLVSVRCISYNHAPYIKDCMNGFTMQETTFPYVCVIDDDASTDSEPEVITNYMAEHFNMDDKDIVKSEETDDYRMIFAQHKTNKNCFFAVYFLKYNHYSIRKSRENYVASYVDGIKYMAICEGDDYWIDPLKLQKQVDYMESHPECTMTCSGSKWFSERRNEFIADQYCQKSEGLLNPADIINRTGYYIPTCSIIYRPEMMNDYPVYCKLCPVGDWPMQIMAAMKGSVYYFNELMCVYRTENDTSWTSQQKCDSLDPVRLNLVKSLVKMFEGFSDDYPEYKIIFKDKVAEFICKNMPRWIYGKKDLNIYKEIFSTEISAFSLKWKLYYFVSLLRLPLVKLWYRKIFLRRYILKVGDKLL